MDFVVDHRGEIGVETPLRGIELATPQDLDEFPEHRHHDVVCIRISTLEGRKSPHGRRIEVPETIPDGRVLPLCKVLDLRDEREGGLRECTHLSAFPARFAAIVLSILARSSVSPTAVYSGWPAKTEFGETVDCLDRLGTSHLPLRDVREQSMRDDPGINLGKLIINARRRIIVIRPTNIRRNGTEFLERRKRLTLRERIQQYVDS